MNVGKIKIDQTFLDDKVADAGQTPASFDLSQVKARNPDLD
jgi:hypothetical protein